MDSLMTTHNRQQSIYEINNDPYLYRSKKKLCSQIKNK